MERILLMKISCTPRVLNKKILKLFLLYEYTEALFRYYSHKRQNSAFNRIHTNIYNKTWNTTKIEHT